VVRGCLTWEVPFDENFLHRGVGCFTMPAGDGPCRPCGWRTGHRFLAIGRLCRRSPMLRSVRRSRSSACERRRTFDQIDSITLGSDIIRSHQRRYETCRVSLKSTWIFTRRSNRGSGERLPNRSEGCPQFASRKPTDNGRICSMTMAT